MLFLKTSHAYTDNMAYFHFFKKLSPDLVRDLIKVSVGLNKADILVKNVKLVNVFTSEVIDSVSIAISRGFIATVTKSGNVDRVMGTNTVIVDGMNRLYAVPGFIDAHVHVESTFLNPVEFSKLALIHGTTTVVADPHEIVNVCGLACLEWFVNASRDLPIKILVQIPCCIPPVSEELDNPGATLPLNIVEELVAREDYFGLGELMNYAAILEGNEEYIRAVLKTTKLGKRVYGHIPSGNEEHLNAYALSYASSCHEVVTVEEALEKLRLGYYVMLRTGGAWRNADEILPKLKSIGIDLSRVMLVVDDTTVFHLVEQGYMDLVARTIMEFGFDPVEAIRLITINPARYLGIDNFVGSIAPGRVADIVLVDDLRSLRIKRVISYGVVYDESDIVKIGLETNRLPNTRIMNVSNLHSWRQLVYNTSERGHVKVRVIKVMPGTPLTREDEAVLPIIDGYVVSVPEEDVIHVASIDRYKGGKSIGVGFVRGLGLIKGAVAQTLAHDTHNILVYGVNPHDMFMAIKVLDKLGGGIVVVVDGKILAKLELSIAGLMSTKEYMEVYREFKEVARAIGELGFPGDIHSFILTVSVISLPVIPEIRITPKGLVNVTNGKIVSLLKEVEIN